MAHQFNDWTFECIESLPSSASLELQQAVEIVCNRINDTEPKLFKQFPLTNQKLLAQRANELSQQVTTEEELTATTHIFAHLYDVHLRFNSSISKPQIKLPLRDERPYIDDSTPPVGVLDELIHILYAHHPKSSNKQFEHLDRDQASLGHALLTVAYCAGGTSLKELIAVVSTKPKEWVVISEPFTLASTYIKNKQRRVYLLDEAVMAMHKISQILSPLSDKKKDKCVKRALDSWLIFACHMSPVVFREAIKSISLTDLVKHLCFIKESAGTKDWLTRHNAIEHHTFVRTFTGQHIEYNKAPKKQRVIETKASVVVGSRLNLKSSEYLLSKLKNLLNSLDENYESDDNYRSKETLLQLKVIYQRSCHWKFALPIWWLASQIMHGTPWKERLRVSTLLNYHSVIERFIQNAWKNGTEIHYSLEEFEQCCQYGIEQLKNPGEQRTIVRFLNFCQTWSEFPDIDPYDFELLPGVKDTRPHYIPPSIFDAVCQQYRAKHDHHSFDITLVINLCYYGGLRKSEALNLRLLDVNFDTGMIYIQKGKTPHAKRKIPLALFPETVLESLKSYIDERDQKQKSIPLPARRMFETSYYNSLADDFIQLLRAELKDNSIVTHSLRHCAENNWTYLLSMMIFKPHSKLKPYFTHHPLFDELQQARLRYEFKCNGIKLTPYFHILDWVSMTSGHAAVSVDVDCYLHMLDWTSIAINYRPQKVTKAAIRYWTSNSNYGYERQKQLTNSSQPTRDRCFIDNKSLSQWSMKYWKTSQQFSLAKNRPSDDINVENNLTTLSTFNKEIEKLEANIQAKADVEHWLMQSGSAPASYQLEPRQMNAWISLCSSLSYLTTSSDTTLRRTKRQLERYQTISSSENGTITSYRALTTLIHVYQILGLPNVRIKVVGSEACSQTQNWLALLKKHGIESKVTERSKDSTHALVKPYALRWALWPDLHKIIDLLLHYLNYRISCCTNVPAVNNGEIQL